MKIGVISDTHLRKPTPELYQLQHTVFADVSMILHAGDLTELEVLEAFSGKEVVAVSGNMDARIVMNQLPSKKVIEIQGFRIGLTHGWGNPFGMPKKLVGAFDKVDAIVYGHTHRPDNKIREGILFFNPGAFFGGFPFARKRSVGILTLGERISGQIINL
ncbi:MAG: metallophosphoesterase family protein [Deltaproteobacteria bacterium]|nr:metallophosphoesterase family protein [Deltaproteobacteria bacterium]MBW2019152.1 metallophosphoesterase family protein [Deltaproteobacteria bacterium]MBW2073219.1 metallophosphoesterase family protein [Deltaproteobacteria bacterium]RLB83838.1 MAG: YfcE family phosphodiesterase [Deltaproteobacteria bacterium]